MNIFSQTWSRIFLSRIKFFDHPAKKLLNLALHKEEH
jgi:hypothetical protein